jgi:aryl-alcohol dehydrogenase-like predicted oxidoreductase
MEKVTYGSIELLPQPASRIVLGTASDPIAAGENADALFDGAVERGIYFFDTARSYGRAEEVLGDWIRRRGNRERVIVLTKCGDIRNGIVKVDRGVIREQLETSLKTLGTDYVDVLLLHRDDPDTPVGEVMETLHEVKREGKVRLYGVSNWTVDRIREANRYAYQNRIEDFSVSSPNYSLALQLDDMFGGGCVSVSGPDHREDRDWYEQTRMPVVSYSSLARGFFSGKFRSDDPEGAKRVLDIYAQKGYLYPENLLRLKRAEELARQKGLTVPEIAMRFVFANRMNMFAVVSTTKPERLDSSIRAAANPLTAAEAEWLETGENA